MGQAWYGNVGSLHFGQIINEGRVSARWLRRRSRRPLEVFRLGTGGILSLLLCEISGKVDGGIIG